MQIPPHNNTRYKEQQYTSRGYHLTHVSTTITLTSDPFTHLPPLCSANVYIVFFTEKNHTTDDLTFTSLVKKTPVALSKQLYKLPTIGPRNTPHLVSTKKPAHMLHSIYSTLHSILSYKVAHSAHGPSTANISYITHLASH